MSPSMLTRVAAFARSPQGRRLTRSAARFARDRENRRRVAEQARRIAQDPRARRGIETVRGRFARRSASRTTSGR